MAREKKTVVCSIGFDSYVGQSGSVSVDMLALRGILPLLNTYDCLVMICVPWSVEGTRIKCIGKQKSEFYRRLVYGIYI